MNAVIRHIEYLISRKDCVIIPGIGAILAKYQSARIDESSGLLLPPERVYTFNKDINHNDGTLACSIARAESISYESACKKMESEIELIQHWLHSKGQITIGRIGILRYIMDDDTVEFEPKSCLDSVTVNILYPAIRLNSTIDMVPVSTLTSKSTVETTSYIKKNISRNKYFARIAASIVFILGICILAYQPISHGNNDAMMASLAPAFSTNGIDVNEDLANSILGIYKSDKYKAYSEIEVEAAIPSDCESEISNSTPIHYVVVAAFRTNKEAEKYIFIHSSESLRAMQYKNLYVVYCSKCSDKNEAYKNCCKAISKYPGAWICSQ